jgi:quinol monooxygenase YgiN
MQLAAGSFNNSKSERQALQGGCIMIVVRIDMDVIPDKQKEMVQTLLSMIESMKKGAGCLSYTLFSNIEDKNFLILLGEWQTRKDLDNHLISEIFSIFLGTKSLLKKPHGIIVYTVIKSEGMEAVDNARRKENYSAVAPVL